MNIEQIKPVFKHLHQAIESVDKYIGIIQNIIKKIPSFVPLPLKDIDNAITNISPIKEKFQDVDKLITNVEDLIKKMSKLINMASRIFPQVGQQVGQYANIINSFEEILLKIKEINKNHEKEVKALIEIITSDDNEFDTTFKSNTEIIKQMMSDPNIQTSLEEFISQVESIFKQINKQQQGQQQGLPSTEQGLSPIQQQGLSSSMKQQPSISMSPSSIDPELFKQILKTQKTQQTLQKTMISLLEEFQKLKSYLKQQKGGKKKKNTKKRKYIKKRLSNKRQHNYKNI